MKSWTTLVAEDRERLCAIIHDLRCGMVNATDMDFLYLFVDEALNAKHRTGYVNWNGDPIHDYKADI